MRTRRAVIGALTPMIVSVVLPRAASTAKAHETAPASLRGAIAASGRACPDVPVSVLAAQLEVASGFQPLATAPDGRRGIAAFTPQVWAVWAADADGDGLRSALDPADAIDAQARRMCWLYRLAVGSKLRGDRVQLALAAYDAGWPAVLRVGGIPASSRSYVDRVWATSSRFGRDRAGTGFGSAPNAALGPPPPVANPRGAAEAMTWARAQTVGEPKWYQLCLNFMAQSYGWSYSGTRYAIDHWWVVPAHLRHPRDRNPPAGALMYWDTGLRPGHVALSLGDGLIASNDIGSLGHISVVPASAVEARWGARYLGWTAPYFPGAGHA